MYFLSLFSSEYWPEVSTSSGDFKHGFFSCDLPMDAIQISVWVDTKCGKHTLREDRHQRTEKYKTTVKHNDDQRQILDSMTVSDLSHSGDWIPTPEFNYKPKLFDDPRNEDSSKEICLHFSQSQHLSLIQGNRNF